MYLQNRYQRVQTIHRPLLKTPGWVKCLISAFFFPPDLRSEFFLFEKEYPLQTNGTWDVLVHLGKLPGKARGRGQGSPFLSFQCCFGVPGSDTVAAPLWLEPTEAKCSGQRWGSGCAVLRCAACSTKGSRLQRAYCLCGFVITSVTA